MKMYGGNPMQFVVNGLKRQHLSLDIKQHDSYVYHLTGK